MGLGFLFLYRKEPHFDCYISAAYRAGFIRAGNVDEAYKNEVQWMFSSHCAFLNLAFAAGKAKNENVHKTLI